MELPLRMKLEARGCIFWFKMVSVYNRWLSQTFNLMELCQVGAVNGLVSEDSVYAEVLCWFETFLRQFIEHA